MAKVFLIIFLFLGYAWCSNQDFNDYELAHSQIQVSQK